jgi:hypothetical protein
VVPSKISVFAIVFDLDSEKTLTVPVGEFTLKERKWGDEYYKITMEGFDSTVHYSIDLLISLCETAKEGLYGF